MRAFFRILVAALQLRVRYQRRIALSLERLVRLYEMDLESRDLIIPEKGREAEVEVLYGPQEVKEGEWED